MDLVPVTLAQARGRHAGISRPEMVYITALSTGSSNGGLVTELPMTVLFFTMAFVTGSSALTAIAIQSAVALAVNGFAVYAMRQVMRENAYNFLRTGPASSKTSPPFSAACSNALRAVHNVRRGAPDPRRSEVGLPGEPDTGVHLLGAWRGPLRHRHADGPRHAQSVTAVALVSTGLPWGTLTDGGVMIAFALAWVLVDAGRVTDDHRVDPLVARGDRLHMPKWACRSCGTTSAPHGLRPLASEEEQLTITRESSPITTPHGDLVGTLNTRLQRGKRRFVEIELGFDGEKSVEHVHVLSRHMEQALAAELPDLHFRIVPVVGT